METLSDAVVRVLTKSAEAIASASVVTCSESSVAVQPSGSAVSSTSQIVPGSSRGRPSAQVQAPEPSDVAIVAAPDELAASSQDHANSNVASSITPAGALVVLVIWNVLVVLVTSTRAGLAPMVTMPSAGLVVGVNPALGSSTTWQSAPVGRSVMRIGLASLSETSAKLRVPVAKSPVHSMSTVHVSPPG